MHILRAHGSDTCCIDRKSFLLEYDRNQGSSILLRFLSCIVVYKFHNVVFKLE